MSLGSFSVDAVGRISLPEGGEAGFDFEWRGRQISLVVEDRASSDGGTHGLATDDQTGCRIRIRARAGRVPSTATAAGRRPDAFLLARRLVTALPAGWRLQLLADHRVQVEAEEWLPMPALIGELLLPAARFTLELAPYLDLLDEEGMGVDA